MRGRSGICPVLQMRKLALEPAPLGHRIKELVKLEGKCKTVGPEADACFIILHDV